MNNNVENKDKTLVLIPGSTGEVGLEYFNYFSQFDDKFDTFGFTSNLKSVSKQTILVDFLNPLSVNKCLNGLDIEQYKSLILIHCIGKDEFENWGYPISDSHDHSFTKPDIYASNFQTYQHVSEGILKQFSDKIKFVVIGGTRDSEITNPYQQSYSNSKNELRELMREQVIEYSNVSSLVINVSSIDTGGDLKGRPFSDTKHWLKLDELLLRTREIIPLDGHNSYSELTVLNPVLKFDKASFYSDSETFRRRMKEVHNIVYKV